MQTMEQSASSGGAGAGVEPVNPPRRPAPWPVQFYRSAVGKKWVMAITGIMLMGFVFGHMVGNLKMYQGAHALNVYGETLRELLPDPVKQRVDGVLQRAGGSRDEGDGRPFSGEALSRCAADTCRRTRQE